MTILTEFEYYRPINLKDALVMLSDFKDGRVLAGGTDLINSLNDEVMRPSFIIDIKEIKKLRTLKVTKKKVTFGSLTTFSDLIDSKALEEVLPVMKEMSLEVASVGVRNRATLVGNICSAVPSLDSAGILMAFDTTVHVESFQSRRDIPLEKWFKGVKKTDLKANEMVTGITINLPQIHGASFMKLKRYKGEDLAQVTCTSVALLGNEYHIAFAAVAPVPVRAKKIEAFLKGKELTDQLIEEAMNLVEEEISPITDIRATKEYRLHMSRIMLKRSLKQASRRLKASLARGGRK